MTLKLDILDSVKERVIGLDILRGIAILLVMYEHGNSLLPDQVIKYFELPRPSIDGVSIFFVLSGFLIGGILLKIIETSDYAFKDILNFWIRRWLRTIPNYYFILLILILCQSLLLNNLGPINYRYFIFSQNLYQSHPPFFPEAWSLSIEEWFYLLFPILTYLLLKILNKKKKAIIITTVLFLSIPLILRIVKYNYQIGNIDWDLNFRKIIILRLDSLMYGILGAYISVYKTTFWKKYRKVGLIFSGFLILFLILYSSLNNIKPLFSTIYHFNLESIAVLFSLPYFSTLKFTKYKTIATIFTFISLISYSMYLINLTLIRVITIPAISNLIGLSHSSSHFLNGVIYLFQYFLFWFLTILFSYFIYIFLELPIMNLRNRILIK